MKVLVTGANGHLGFNLCKALLARGRDEVRASVRSLADEAKTAPLRALGDVELHALEVRDRAQFEKAVAGVDTLFHVAATYSVFTNAEQADAMVKDSVEGVETAMRAAAKAGVRKVVLTSSVVTVPMRRPGEAPATEEEWATDLTLPYFRAKTEGERTAWRLAKELGLNLVTVLPGGIGGPGFARPTPTIEIIEGIMLGTMRMGAPLGGFTWVDVRDAVRAHLLAADKDARGRFLVSEAVTPTFVQITQLMHELDPTVPATSMTVPRFMRGLFPFFDALNAKLLGSPRLITPEGAATMDGRIHIVSSARAQAELGWKPEVPMRESLKETMETIRALRRAAGKTKLV